MNYSFTFTVSSKSGKYDISTRNNGSVWGTNPLLCQYGAVGDIRREFLDDKKNKLSWLKPFVTYLEENSKKILDESKTKKIEYIGNFNGEEIKYVLDILCDVEIPMSSVFYN